MKFVFLFVCFLKREMYNKSNTFYFKGDLNLLFVSYLCIPQYVYVADFLNAVVKVPFVCVCQ